MRDVDLSYLNWSVAPVVAELDADLVTGVGGPDELPQSRIAQGRRLIAIFSPLIGGRPRGEPLEVRASVIARCSAVAHSGVARYSGVHVSDVYSTVIRIDAAGATIIVRRRLCRL